jgi:hypothetical protein
MHRTRTARRKKSAANIKMLIKKERTFQINLPVQILEEEKEEKRQKLIKIKSDIKTEQIKYMKQRKIGS